MIVGVEIRSVDKLEFVYGKVMIHVGGVVVKTPLRARVEFHAGEPYLFVPLLSKDQERLEKAGAKLLR